MCYSVKNVLDHFWIEFCPYIFNKKRQYLLWKTHHIPICIYVYFVKSQNGPATVLCVFFIASWWFWSHEYMSKSYYLSKITHGRPLNTFTGILESHHQTLKTSLVYDNSILRELSDILAFISIIKPLFFHVIRYYGNTIIMYFEPKT